MRGNESASTVKLQPEVLAMGPDAEGIKWLVLDSPQRANALNEQLVEGLLRNVSAAQHDGTRVLAIRGNGKNFCAGFDLSETQTEDETRLLYRFVKVEELLQAMRYAPFITVACTHGAAFGAGADLVAACDYRVGLRDCRFRFPGFQFGIALGTRQLVRLIGPDRTRDTLLRNRIITAAQAFEWGLLTQIVETSEEFHGIVSDITRESARLTTEALTQLLALTREDTRDQDMADLVKSAKREGLVDRITAYQAATRKARQ